MGHRTIIYQIAGPYAICAYSGAYNLGISGGTSYASERCAWPVNQAWVGLCSKIILVKIKGLRLHPLRQYLRRITSALSDSVAHLSRLPNSDSLYRRDSHFFTGQATDLWT